jgi:hypothetical protein
VAEQTKRKKWSDVKAQLVAFDRKALVSLLGELYDASVANRRFLHSRLTPGSRAIEEYRRSTGDASGTVDLMLTFVEAGTEQAANLGYGDDAHFNALQIRLDAVAKEFDTLPADVRAKVRVRLGRVQVRAQDVGWGFSDAVDDVIHSLDARAARVRPGQVNRR